MLKLNQLMSIIFLVFIIIFAANSVEAHLGYEAISTEELSKKLDNGDDLCLINVLPKIVHDAKHIKGSINIPIGKIKSSDKLPKDKDKLLIFYCMGTL